MNSRGWVGCCKTGVIVSGQCLVLTLTSMLIGCVTLPTTENLFLKDEPPCQIITTWQPDVIQAQDSVNDGRPLLGLGGRLYIFGKEIGRPLKTKGNLVIDLYDLSGTKSPDPVHLEQWRFEPNILSQLGKNDPLGYGYTLFLPWSTCRPEITQILLKIKFQPKSGFPLYSEAGPITISQPGSLLNHPEYQSKESRTTLSPNDSLAQPGTNQGPNGTNRTGPGNALPNGGQNSPGARQLPNPGQPNSNPMNQGGNPTPSLGAPSQQNLLPYPNSYPGNSRPMNSANDQGMDNRGPNTLTPNRGPSIGIPIGSAPARISISPNSSFNSNPGSLPSGSPQPNGNPANGNGPSQGNAPMSQNSGGPNSGYSAPANTRPFFSNSPNNGQGLNSGNLPPGNYGPGNGNQSNAGQNYGGRSGATAGTPSPGNFQQVNFQQGNNGSGNSNPLNQGQGGYSQGNGNAYNGGQSNAGGAPNGANPGNGGNPVNNNQGQTVPRFAIVP